MHKSHDITKIPLEALQYLLSEVRLTFNQDHVWMLSGFGWIPRDGTAVPTAAGLFSNQLCDNMDLQTFWDVWLYENIAYILIINFLTTLEVDSVYF